MIREPSPRYVNYEWTKEKGFFGHWQLLKGDYVFAYGDIHFVDQILYEEENLRLKMTQLANCINLNTYNVIAALAQGLGATLTIGQQVPFAAPPMQFDRILIKCFSNATIVVQVTAETEDDPCGFPVERDDQLPEAGTHNGTPPEPNPLDEPFDLGTAPYDAGSQDDGETYVPDEVPEVPEYPEARQYSWTLRWRFGTQPTNIRTETGTTTGPIYSARVANRPTSTPGAVAVAIEFESGNPVTLNTAVVVAPVPVEQAEGFLVIVSFTAV